MCFTCPAYLTVSEDETDLRVSRIAETEVTPADVAPDATALEEFKRGERFLIALQATVYVQNRPVVTETLHGVMECDLPGEIACAFEHHEAMGCLARLTMDEYRDWRTRHQQAETSAGE